MATRILLLLAALSAALHSESRMPTSTGAPLIAVFYAFEHQPSPELVTHMQGEVERILAPSGLTVAWRPLDTARAGENYNEILVLRFHGSCDASVPVIYSELGPEGTVHELAETKRTDGKMLPFGSVECDQLRRYLAPVVARDTHNSVFGRAVARVVAHEMYHMLTGSVNHAKQGIARASHSRQELVSKTFDFGKAETEWLRNWRNKSLLAGEGLSPSDLNQH